MRRKISKRRNRSEEGGKFFESENTLLAAVSHFHSVRLPDKGC
jgi:hypothetical protein